MSRQWRLFKRAAAVARTNAPGRAGALTMALLAACGDEPVVAPPAAVVSAAESRAAVSAATSDRDILIALYNATDGPNWVNNENWLTDAPIGDWYGVDTDASGRVVRLDLSGQLDQQTREWDTHGLAGSIPLELGGLASLETLSLARNELTGAIPPELGGLANLKTLSLGRNELTGAIPPEVGGLVNLKTLSLRWNALTGSIPPELGGLAGLDTLSLTVNELTGSIPPELGGLASLERLWLGSNELTGSVPSSFLRLDALKEFWFPGNAGLCAPGTTGFVEWLSRVERYQGPLCNAADEAALVSLHETAGGANWTNPEGWLGGGALEEWHGVTVDSLGRVTVLDLTGNGLSGRLPWTMGELAQMTELRIAGNPDLAGRLPLSLTGLSLRALHYSGTDLCAPAEEVFREWLGGIQSHQGTGEECALFPDRAALEALFETTGGPSWIESDNWLTLAPLALWDGVRTDADGRVTGLDLRGNGLEGPIPPELGTLASARVVILAENELSGPIPAGLGGLASVEELDLEENQLTSVPPELGELANLQALTLNFNRLTTVPPELGRLSRLDYLGLWSNELTSIPAELGELGNLRELDLDENRLTAFPPELAGLERLEILWAASNELASIPPELGAMNSLRLLVLERNRLTDFGMEPGGYPNLRTLDLSSNDLTSFPSELGALGNLRQLELDGNRLTDVPPGLGGLAALEILDVASNELNGSLPAELVELTGLRSLGLADNVGLTGALPLDLTALESLEDLHTTGTELCAPADPAFLDWLEGVTRQRVALCERESGAAAYLTQAVQSRDFPVPLVAGKPALLRVFVTVEQATDATMPPVRATFYRDGAVTYELDIPAKQDPVPAEIDESSLSKSVNAEIPGWVIQPGLEAVIEPDPEGTLDPVLGVARRIPATGRMAVDVHAMPVFEVTLVPFIWDASPDSSIVDITSAMAADPEGHELFERTRLLLPVAELDVTAHPAVASPTNNGFEILRLTEMIRVAEGGRGHYLGLMAGPTAPSNLLGVANDIGNWSSFSVLDSETIAHEFGHNRNLYHAPCGGAGGPDRYYPYENGNIGAWGYDFRTSELVPPHQPDYMSYCGPTWTSDYQFTNALRYRLETETSSIVVVAAETRAAASSRTLLVWGGLDGQGAPYLKPAFFIDAPPTLPSSEGAWSLTGRDAGGGELFSVSLGMAEFTDTEEDHAGFTVALPVTWTGQLASITLEGPGGSANLDQDTDASVTILRDAATGRIRAVLDGPPEAAAGGGGAARAPAPPPPTGVGSALQPRDTGRGERSALSSRCGTLPDGWRGVILTLPGSASRPSLRRRIMTRARPPLPALVLLVFPALAAFSAFPAQAQRFSIEDVLSPGYPVQLVSARAADRIAWIEYEEGKRNVYTAEAPGFTPVRLTRFEDDDGRDLSNLRISDDGSTLVFLRGHTPNRQGWIANPASDPRGAERAAWAVSTAGGEPWRVAEAWGVALSPDGEWIAWESDGDIYRAPVNPGIATGDPERPLFSVFGSQDDPVWSPDSRRLAFVSDREDHCFIGVYDTERPAVTYLGPAVDRDTSPTWSPDGTRVAFIRRPGLPFGARAERGGATGEGRAEDVWPAGMTEAWFAGGYDFSIWVGDARTGEAVEVWHSPPGDSIYREVREVTWAGDHIIFQAEPDGWRRYYAVAADGGTPDPVELTPGDGIAEYISLSPDGRTLFYATNAGDIDRRHLWRVPTAGGSARQLTRGDGVETNPAVLASGEQVALLTASASHPLTVAVAPASGGDARTIRELPARYPLDEHVAPEAVTLNAEDGFEFYNQLFMPPDLEPGEQRPALIFIHGGSRRQMLLGYHYMHFYHMAYAINQYFANKGYVVLSVNYRSGIGYGRDFRNAPGRGREGNTEYQDIRAAGEYLRDRPDVDPARIGLWGLSYGGILTAQGLARDSDLFAAGVDIAGVHLWGNSIDPESVSYQSSAISEIENWTSPVLLIHGDDDRNVAFSQTVGLVQLLRAHGVPHELIVFPDDVHDFLLHERWLTTFDATDRFFDRYLMEGRAVATEGRR